MNKKSCLHDRDLLLLYYDEPTDAATKIHLECCLDCQKRMDTLRNDLAKLPQSGYHPDDLAGTRMAARVTEQLRKPRRRFWLPAIGASAAAALVLVISMTSTPPPDVTRIVKTPAPQVINLDLSEDLPDIDFLEEMELIRELELLAQLEGV